MLRVVKFLSFIFLLQFALVSGVCYGDEEVLFSSDVAPDALIALDLSGSMDRPPTGDMGYSNAQSGGVCSGDKLYGSPTGSYNIYCENSTHLYGATDACTEPFYKDSSGKVDCRKKIIAKKAIYALLDADMSGDDNKYNPNKIDKTDERVLGVRMGYMKFQCCDHTFTTPSDDSGYTGGCNVLRQGFKELNQGTYGYFRDIYTYVTSDINYDCNTYSRTPLAGILNEGKSYLDNHKSSDLLKECRKKFVIFITDGWDTLACGADPRKSLSETKGYSYKRRTASVAAAKALNEAGYKVFVIGFGMEMPKTLANTLNWAAYFGGSDNPDEPNKENGVLIPPNANPTSPPTITVASACNTVTACESFNPYSIGYPGGVDALGNDIGANCNYTPNPDCCTLAPNDPGFKNLTGYAFFANDSTALKAAMRRAMEYIKEARYSFTVSSVSAARILSENYLYEASFIPVMGDPFWLGHLKKYQIDDSGGVVRPSLWDAGDKLLEKTAASRRMYTLLGGTMTPFNTSISPTYFGYKDDAAGQSARDAVVGYFRGDPSYNQDSWKLGDIFHSNPITIASPPIFYNDFRSPAAYADHKENNKNRERLLVVGANDGQFHAFSASTGEEKWSFFPPNLLPKLPLVSHATEPTTQYHQFFVDGPVTVAEAWLGSGEGLDKPGITGKNAGDWRTLLIFGLGRGARESDLKSEPAYLWSSSPNCDSDFKKRYNPPHQYYCGYYAFDVTDTSQTQPTFKWRINVTSLSQGKFLDEPWSKIVTGRVRIDGNEKWVGFMGAGYNDPPNADYPEETTETKGKRGKGFFVIDLSNGNILWSYTKDDDSSMDYAIPASPAVVDWDSDGFIDTAYIADLGGNVFRVRFCSYEDYKNNQACNTTHWKGGRLYASTEGRPVFTRPTVASDEANRLWVFWGTGNRLDPKGTFQERFFGLKDTFVPAKSGTIPPSYTISNLQDITTTTYAGVLPGWYLLLTGSGEKNLSAPTVFAGMVLFTTYTPPPSAAATCDSAGTGRFYAMAMMPMVINGVQYNTGAGLWANGAKSISLGTGVPTSPIISQKPKEKPGATDVFVTVSGGGGAETVIKSLSELTDQKTSAAMARFGETPPQAQVTHWRDKRVQ